VRKRPRNDVTCYEFKSKTFFDLVLEHSGSAGEPPNDQTSYLAAYLKRLGAKSLVVELHYIDRHFMEEVGLYYSSRLQQVPNSCARIHVFKNEHLTDAVLDDRLRRFAVDCAGVTEEFEAEYLGFVVVRPVPAVPIGRTVLQPLTNDPLRRFPTLVDYKVHFLGIELKLSGLGFQQQDVAVAACSTTALWTSLQRVCRHEGERTPTPSSITISGDQYTPPAGRALPSGGLTVPDMQVAFRRYGFSSIPMVPAYDLEAFRFLLNIYLKSGIPVVLTTRPDSGPGHAVAVVGFKADTVVPTYELIPGSPGGEAPVNVLARNLAFGRIYVHDDRIGPYARARLIAEPNSGQVLFETAFHDGTTETEPVDAALAPLYAKVRFPAGDLLESAGGLHEAVSSTFGALTGQFGLELFYERSGTYLASLFGKIPHNRLAPFLRGAALSRYLGVLRWYSDDGRLLVDLVVDTTDILRDDPAERLLAIVAYDPNAFSGAAGLAAGYGVPVC
jgi:hypothetical protein